MKKLSFFDEIERNKKKSLILGVFIFFLLVSLIYVIFQILAPELSIFSLVFAVIFTFFYTYYTYNYGDQIVLSAVGAKLIDDSDTRYVHLVNAVEGLSIAAGIPRPKIYIIESNEMNAFATGKDQKSASVAVTTGLLKRMNRSQLEGVIGHELSHIRNFDIRFSTVVAAMVGLTAILSDLFLRSVRYGGFGESHRKRGYGLLVVVGVLLAIFAPIAVRIVQFAISRKRELLADASSVQLTRYPDGLALALEKIKRFNKGNMRVSEAISHMFFVDPNKSPLDSLYETHPPLDERIKILRSM